MNEIQALLERQARWQKTRQTLSWPEKIRMAEAIRETVLALRQLRNGQLKARRHPLRPASPLTAVNYA